MTELRIPYQSADDPTASVVDAARKVLSGEELAVTEQIAYDALERGTTKIGDLLDELESAGADGRRRILDKARTGVGLMTVEDQEGHDRFVSANSDIAAARPRAPRTHAHARSRHDDPAGRGG